MIRKLEVVVLHLILGAMPPLVGFLTGWWSTFFWLPEKVVMVFALGGLAIGVLADGLWLRGWVRRAEAMPWAGWIGTFLFYSVGTYGFFMGMPAGNVGLALPAGFVVGAMLVRRGASREIGAVMVRRTRLVTTGVLALLCAASAWLGLTEESTGHELQSMLRLSFTVTHFHLVMLVVVGGGTLLVLHWMLVAMAARWTMGRLAASPRPAN